MLPIDDWGGFERLVAALHETGTVSVDHDVAIRDSRGTPRRIDVLITHRDGMYEHRIIAECKYWNRSVPRHVVDKLATSVRELNAAKGVIFSARGFQRGAVQTAKALGIELFKVRTLAADEWLIPGRHVPFYAQLVSRGIGQVRVADVVASGAAKVPERLSFPFKAPPHEFLLPSSLDGLSLVACIEAFSLTQLRTALLGNVFKSEDGATVFSTDVHGVLRSKVNIPLNGGELRVSKVEMDIALKVRQARVDFDQANAFKFMLALDDCVNGTTRYAFRGLREAMTQYSGPREALPSDHALRNGIVCPFFKRSLFDYDLELALYGDTKPTTFLAFPISELPGMPEWFLAD